MTLSAGTRLGPYEIVARIGAGGMGEVWMARDDRLRRRVAVKVLPPELSSDPERLRRFEQEARSASALTHPNIVTIHDIGRTGEVAWIAMELVEGDSLRGRIAAGPLPMETVLAIATQLAEGLSRAHAAGIVHRDLKPENVMVTSDGLVKILDFGLAKLEPAGGVVDSRLDTVVGETRTGVVLGTAGYMSPEQATGRPLDFRSDQFALGAIMFEMASGRRAFGAPSAVEALSAIIRDEPPPLASIRPDVPPGLGRIVARCLAKNPQERYGSTADLARDLRDLSARPAPASPDISRLPGGSRRLRIAAAGLLVLAAAAAIWLIRSRRSVAAPAERSLAVLPFQRVGSEAEEYFSDGITDALTTDLARVRGLLVIARNSAFAYKARNADLRSVARDLHVRYVLSGSVQRAGSSVRVTAQLVDANTGYPVWADRYDRLMKDVFAVEDDISGHIVRALKVALMPSVAAPGPTPGVAAYDAYLRGLYFFHQFAWVEKDKSIPWFEKAVELDPAFAAAHGALASAFAKKAFEGDPDGIWTARADAEIEKALALDPDLYEAFLARGNLAWRRESGFPHERAASDFRRAIQANPNSDAAHASLASLLYHVGLMEESLAEYRLALRINPRQLDYLYRIPRIHLYQQKYSLALDEFDAEPRFRDDFLKPLVLEHLGRHAEALAVARTHALNNPTHTKVEENADAASALAVVLARDGDATGVEMHVRLAAKGDRGSHFHHAAYNIATAYALLGRNTEALSWLRKTAAEGMPCYPLFEKDPFLDGLRAYPAFQAFLAAQRALWTRLRTAL